MLVLFTSAQIQAQCAMCKATAEESGFESGLNSGIIYLMIIPYILLIFFFRKKIVKLFKELFRKDKKEDYTIENWY